MNKTLCSTLLLTGLFSGAILAETEHSFKKVQDAIKYRQSAFKLIAHNFSDMGAMMKNKKPFDEQVFAARADNLAALSLIPLEGFIPNSDKGDTEALYEIWDDKVDFEDKMLTFQKNAANLARIAATGDKKAIKTAFGKTAKSCKTCHKAYKKD